jgi:hypothetical protein
VVVYNFKRQFIEPIRAGTKQQTIRADRKRHTREGETLQLYTGMRTKQCRLIGLARCRYIVPITLDSGPPCVSYGSMQFSRPGRLRFFARCDGFESWDEMRQFWRDNHPGITVFTGMLIYWWDLKIQ